MELFGVKAHRLCVCGGGQAEDCAGTENPVLTDLQAPGPLAFPLCSTLCVCVWGVTINFCFPPTPPQMHPAADVYKCPPLPKASRAGRSSRALALGLPQTFSRPPQRAKEIMFQVNL